MKKFLAILVLGLLFCNAVQSTESMAQRHGKFTSDYVCVNAMKTEMDITETEGTLNILIGDRNYSDEYIQNLFKKNPEGNISIKHIRSDSYNQIVEVSGMFNIFNGELYFFEIENEGFLSTYLSQGVLIHHMFIHPDENKIRNGKSKRVLGMNLIELSELEYQQLLPLYSKRYHEISKKLNSKVKNGIEPYDDFNKEVDKIFGKDGKIYSDMIISFACFEE